MEDKTEIMEPAEEARAAEGSVSDETPAGARPISRRTAIAAAAAVAAVVVIGGAACASASAQPEATSSQRAASSQAASSRQGGGSSSYSSSGSASAASSEASEPGTGGEEAGEAGGSGPAQDAQGAQESGAGRQEAARSQQGGGASGGGGEPAKQRVWVVDQPATTQTIHHDAIMGQEDGGSYSKCTVCGADITGCETEHTKQHALDGVLNASWTTADYPPIDVVIEPAWDEVIEIPEQGHWEWR